MTLKATFQKAGVSAVTAAAIMETVISSKGFRVGNDVIPVWMLAGSLGFTASFVNSGLTKYVLPHIPHNAKTQHMESIVLSGMGSVAVFLAVPQLLKNPGVSIGADNVKKMIAAGLAVEAVSAYANDFLLSVEESQGYIM